MTLFERDERLGGHANTVAVRAADGREVALDTGFIVHNQRTYPTLLRLFAELGIGTQDSDMSFGVRCEGCGLEYAGARGMHGRRAHGRACSDAPATCACWSRSSVFTATPGRSCADPAADASRSTEFLRQGSYSRYFTDHFMLPLTGAVWSSSPATIRDFPARYLIRFFANHGMLTVTNSPQWRTVTGGSREYVARIAERLADRVHVRHRRGRLDRARRRRRPCRVNGDHRFDRVVIATHPDQALRMLADRPRPSARCWAAFAYSSNQTVLHTDASLLPRAAGARASWNYLLDACSSEPAGVHVTYHLNRLQALRRARRLLRHPQPDEPHRRRPRAAPDDLRAPDLHAREPGGAGAPAAAPGVSATPTTAAPTTAGDSTRTAACRACAPHSRWGAPGEVGALRGPRGARAACRPAATSSATPCTCGWSTWTSSTSLDRRLWLFGHDRRGLHSIRTRDHLGDPDRTIRDNLGGFLAQHGVDAGAAAGSRC